MNYLKWKKALRKEFLRLKKELGFKTLRLIIPKNHQRGAHIKLKKELIILPYKEIRSQRIFYNFKYNELKLAEVILCHELGHYLNYIKEKEKILDDYKKAINFLLKATEYRSPYTHAEKMDFLKEHKKLILEDEIQAWKVGAKFFKGKDKLYELIERQGIDSYEKGLNFWIEEEIKKHQQS